MKKTIEGHTVTFLEWAIEVRQADWDNDPAFRRAVLREAANFAYSIRHRVVIIRGFDGVILHSVEDDQPVITKDLGETSWFTGGDEDSPLVTVLSSPTKAGATVLRISQPRNPSGGGAVYLSLGTIDEIIKWATGQKDG